MAGNGKGPAEVQELSDLRPCNDRKLQIFPLSLAGYYWFPVSRFLSHDICLGEPQPYKNAPRDINFYYSLIDLCYSCYHILVSYMMLNSRGDDRC